MAGLTQSLCTSFKVELLTATHNFTNGADVFKIALFKANASIVGTYGAGTTNYSEVTANNDETSGTGYTAGGNALTNVTPTSSGTTAFLDFDDTTWSSASITTRGAIIYNTSKSNKAICILDFGGDQAVTSGDFTIVFPAANASNAIIRIA